MSVKASSGKRRQSARFGHSEQVIVPVELDPVHGNVGFGPSRSQPIQLLAWSQRFLAAEFETGEPDLSSVDTLLPLRVRGMAKRFVQILRWSKANRLGSNTMSKTIAVVG
jgi:hypothetical protein